MIRAWASSLGWLLPSTPSAELQAQLKPVAVDLAIMERSVEQLASNQDKLAKRSVEQLASNPDELARKQDQMTQAFATLQAAVQDSNQNTLALAPLAPKAALIPPAPKAAFVPPPKPKAAHIPPAPKAALVPPPKPPQPSDIVGESNTSASASDFGGSGRFGRAFDSDVKTLAGAAVR
jgi:hypothetical protein